MVEYDKEIIRLPRVRLNFTKGIEIISSLEKKKLSKSFGKYNQLGESVRHIKKIISSCNRI